MDTLLVTPEEAARLLGISRSRIYELMRFGALRSVLIGRLRRVPRVALEEYIESLTTGQQ